MHSSGDEGHAVYNHRVSRGTEADGGPSVRVMERLDSERETDHKILERPTIRVLILPKYGPLAASSRQRFLQFLQHFSAAGIDCVVSPLLPDAYLREKFDTGRTNLRHAAEAFLRRYRAIRSADEFDVVLLYLEDYPYLPGLLARSLRRRGIPYLFDMDDAIFHTYDMHPARGVRWLLGDKIQKIAEGAAGVLAGNRYLADYARRYNDNVEIVPTVINPDRYRPRQDYRAGSPFTVGWIGSPSTAQYLSLIRKPLAEFCRRGDRRVVLVGSGPVELPEVPLEIRPWSLESEIDDLRGFDIGIMPLPNSAWARGKCGFKLIQYMGCGVPLVASDVGANVDIVEHGTSGILVSGQDEWVEALERLANDDALRERLGRAGRVRIESAYSIESVFPSIETKVKDAAKMSRRTYDPELIEAFGREWTRFDQSTLSSAELGEMFSLYFDIFPWDRISDDAVGIDVGCGSGRWARFVAPRVAKLHCVDPSPEALEVARRNLADQPNCEFHLAGVNDLPFSEGSLDFGYSLGVLHHIRDTQDAMRRCVSKLKKGAPFLTYLYYAFDNRPLWYRTLWRITVPARILLSRLPYPARYVVTQTLALLVYWPVARFARLMERLGLDVSNYPLAAYRSRSFYVMRTDALDRFGTRIEKRFTREQVRGIMENAGLENIRFSGSQFWCAVGYKR